MRSVHARKRMNIADVWFFRSSKSGAVLLVGNLDLAMARYDKLKPAAKIYAAGTALDIARKTEDTQ